MSEFGSQGKRVICTQLQQHNNGGGLFLIHSALPPPVPSLLEGDGWAELRKQLREFTHATQVELEKERSQLLARAMVAEEQVAELQEYVDKHLVRYKQEIVRMHKLLGTDGSRELSAGASAIPVLLMSQRNLNKEV
ncbi:coiled-coil domain-containing protein 78 [Crotalus adamanteus]|uniref:Coiled-coil domain-containing protein 78 n=1 Tax=Crotalus adamanteus TaxID=8729 RepID=A0AAW1ATZ2_CROAD